MVGWGDGLFFIFDVVKARRTLQQALPKTIGSAKCFSFFAFLFSGAGGKDLLFSYVCRLNKNGGGGVFYVFEFDFFHLWMSGGLLRHLIVSGLVNYRCRHADTAENNYPVIHCRFRKLL